MKKLLVLSMLLICSAALFAENDVTKFLGIPVDGSKSEMIQKLKAKGFRYDSELDCLKGEFNGRDSYISVVTNNDKVYRIMVRDAMASDETSIRIRFNTLCRQFENNKKYVSFDDFILPEDENISYEMSINNKRYQASYFQQLEINDSIAFANEAILALLSKYTEEQLANPTEEMRQEFREATFSYMMDLYLKKSVWFMINERFGEYYIIMYYDNGYNQANGEDL